MEKEKESLRLGFSDIFILVIGCIMMAISLNLFFNPYGIASGGITGIILEKEKESLRLGFSDIFILVIGCIMMAISLNLFFNPYGIASGGITGLAVVLNMLFGIPLWIVNLVLNQSLWNCIWWDNWACSCS